HALQQPAMGSRAGDPVRQRGQRRAPAGQAVDLPEQAVPEAQAGGLLRMGHGTVIRPRPLHLGPAPRLGSPAHQGRIHNIAEPPAGARTESTARRALARPRVECSSSSVAMYEGHMVPSSFIRQTPIPLHISTAAAKPPWPEKSRSVSGSHVRYPAPYRSDSVIGGASTMLPGLSRPLGSKARLTWRKAS